VGHECQGPGSRLHRWRIQFAEYNYEIIYRRGSQNTKADAFSRIGSVSKGGDLSDELMRTGRRKSFMNFMTLL